MVDYGTTSACAENTQRANAASNVAGNYLRVRGEYPQTRLITSSTSELPPRARRIPEACGFAGTVDGTTSACAENTESHR